MRKRHLPMILWLLLVSSTGCGAKETDPSDIDENHITTEETEMKEDEKKAEEAKKTVELSKIPEAPRNQKEYEEMFGVVDESGTWIPPEGAYRDAKTGKIKNKDGVVIAIPEESPHPARPGSKG